MMEEKCRELFVNTFGTEPEAVFFAPGRVNLIGEHIDYSGGLVLPLALDLGIYCAARRRRDKSFRFFSADAEDPEITGRDIYAGAEHNWTDYPAAMIRVMEENGAIFEGGADMAFCADLPQGAGLSSSAAIEIVTGRAMCGLYNKSVSGKNLALCGQRAENIYIGVNCGIMDQFVCSLGAYGQALLIDTKTLEYKPVPLNLDRNAVVIVNSGVRHSLAGSEYGLRRRECEEALRDMRQDGKPEYLCSLSPEEFEARRSMIHNGVCAKRAGHAVYENRRVKEAAAALSQGDPRTCGRLMNESHRSLKELYEVSCPELDLLAETMQGLPGVYGSRMTGGGFGGCTVTLVQHSKALSAAEAAADRFESVFGRRPGYRIICAPFGR